MCIPLYFITFAERSDPARRRTAKQRHPASCVSILRVDFHSSISSSTTCPKSLRRHPNETILSTIHRNRLHVRDTHVRPRHETPIINQRRRNMCLFRRIFEPRVWIAWISVAFVLRGESHNAVVCLFDTLHCARGLLLTVILSDDVDWNKGNQI